MYLLKNSTQYVYVTIREKQTLVNPKYIFRFIQRTTKQEIKLLITTDYSNYKDRFNKFQINTHPHFETVGEYLYYIYETNDNNTDIDGHKLLEQGIMILSDGNFDFVTRQANQTFITRQTQ